MGSIDTINRGLVQSRPLFPGVLMPADLAILRSLVRRFVFWGRLSRSRQHLRGLPDELLADIGSTREEAVREATRFFWDSHQAP